jgi:peptidoglycan/xylan/chitin deacetylase (PgdA/CDA1 family)
MTPSRRAGRGVSTANPSPPAVTALRGAYGYGLSVDVEEWYHTCHVAEYVDPSRRPRLVEEIDALLPQLLETLASAGRRATFFVLGEVAAAHPRRIREIALAGHEVGAHGYLHLRAGWFTVQGFARDVERCRKTLEDLLGVAPRGFRAPEWSLRDAANPRLRELARQGFEYDSSLAPYPGAGSWRNPERASRLRWPDGRELVELPPLSLGALGGRLRLPASGWTGRLAAPATVARAAVEHRRVGGLPVMVVHPWELSGRATPGDLTGLARFLHETGRAGYRGRFVELLAALPWDTLSRAFASSAAGGDATTGVVAPAESPAAILAETR